MGSDSDPAVAVGMAPSAQMVVKFTQPSGINAHDALILETETVDRDFKSRRGLLSASG
ncbi:MAG: hypothetical protein OXC53_02915 [Rhodobacteraceae bacterium]|nr:hypothetical protein [Paracoccaceae bacterium]